MKKSRKIVYWVATLWLSLGLVATGILQILGTTQGMGGSEMMTKLGYPLYLMPLLGVLKILAVVTLLMPACGLLSSGAMPASFSLWWVLFILISLRGISLWRVCLRCYL